MALPKPCATAGCPELTQDTRCPKHQRREYRQDAERRGTAAERGYGSRHRKWRRRVLRKHPVCVRCLEEGRVNLSKVADHIIPISQGGPRFKLSNGQGLCVTHHNRKTAREA